MQVVRFYGIRGDDIHILAKFVSTTDVPEDKIREYAQFLVIGIHAAGDVIDFLNGKFLDLAETMHGQGFAAVEVLDPEDHDSQCKRTFDIAVDTEEKVIKMLTFDVHPADTRPFYAKTLADTKSFGLLS